MRSAYYRRIQRRYPLLNAAKHERKQETVQQLAPIREQIQTNIGCRHPDHSRKNDKARTKTVAVVGGGFAGLSAAYELAHTKKYNVIVLEARKNRVGGRVYSSNKWIDGKVTEHGGELVGSERCHPNWHHYAKLFKLEFVPLADEDATAPNDGDDSTLSAEENAYVQNMYNFYAVLTIHFIMAKIGLASIDIAAPWAGLPGKAALIKEYDNTSLSEFFNSYALGHAINSVFKLVRAEFPPMNDVTSKSHESIIQDDDKRQLLIRAEGVRAYDEYLTSKNKAQYHEGARSADIIAFVKVMEAEFEHNNGTTCHNQSLLFTLSTVRSCQQLYVESHNTTYDKLTPEQQAHADLNFLNENEMFRCKGGNQALANALEQNIKAEGGEIILGAYVRDVIFGTNDVTLKYVEFATGGTLAFKERKADYVVLAVPAAKWSEITFTSEDPAQKIESPLRLPSQPQIGHVMKILFRLNKRFWDDSQYPNSKEKSFMKGPDGTFPLAMTWETTEWQHGEGQYCFVAFSGGRATTILNTEYREANTPKEFLEWFARNAIETQTDGHKGFLADRFVEAVLNDDPVDWMDWTDIGYSCAAPGEITTIGQKVHGAWNGKMWMAGEHACLYQAPGFMEGALLSGRNAAKSVLKATNPTSKKRIHKVTLRQKNTK